MYKDEIVKFLKEVIEESAKSGYDKDALKSEHEALGQDL
jgi:hypothetical protein